MTRPELLAGLCALALSTSASAAGWPDLSREAAGQGGGEDDAAVIVGIEKYAFVAGIPGAAANATDWHVYLTKGRKVPLSHVRLLRDAEGSLEQMRSEAQWAASTVKPGGTLWFVFVGHGAPAKDGSDGVLVGVDAQQRADSMYARSLPQRELLSILAGGKQARAVVVLDACFSGKSSSGQELVHGLQPLIAVKAAKAASKALVFTAGKSDQFAGPLPGAERPAFSYLLLGALRGWGDRNGDGVVSAQEAVEYAQEALLALVKDRTQTPELIGSAGEALVQGAKEKGPDLGELVREIAPPAAKSEVAFGGGVNVNVPKIKVVSAAGSLKAINMKAEQALEDALDKEELGNATPADKAAAWCALAAIGGNNPYKAQAKAGCDEWRRYADNLAKLEKNITEDYTTLAGYLGLRRKTPEQKQAAADAFLATYGTFKDQLLVKAVSRAAAAAKSGKEWMLPDAEHAAEDSKFSSEAFGLCSDKVQCLQQQECRNGKLDKCGELAASVYKGNGALPKNPQRYVAIMKFACDKGDQKACLVVGNTYLYDATVKDVAQAIDYLSRGCDRDDGDACASLSNVYLLGKDGVAKDEAKSWALQQKSCELDTTARNMCTVVGLAYHLGQHGVAKDLAKARRYYQLWCDKHPDQDCAMVRNVDQEQDKERQAAADFQRFVANAQSDYERGMSICASDSTCKYLKENCDKDEAKCGDLGGAFEYGNYNLPKNPVVTFNLKKKGCDRGDLFACYDLGNRYQLGTGVAADKAMAQTYFRRACTGDNAFGCYGMKSYGEGEQKAEGQRRLQQLCDQKKDSTACSYAKIGQ